MNPRERDPRLTTADLASAPPAEERLERDRRPDEEGRPRERWDGNGETHASEDQRVALFPDHLVATTVQRLAQSFARERTHLEAQWGQGDVSTEDLRQALRRYRSFFDRLLSV